MNVILFNTLHSLPSVSPVSRWSFHTRHQDNKGVPRRRGDLCTEPSCHVQPHLPSGEATSGGSDQRRLQIHISGSGPCHGCRRQLPGALPGHRYECRQVLHIIARCSQLWGFLSLSALWRGHFLWLYYFMYIPQKGPTQEVVWLHMESLLKEIDLNLTWSQSNSNCLLSQRIIKRMICWSAVLQVEKSAVDFSCSLTWFLKKMRLQNGRKLLLVSRSLFT